jgi:hypothetical protein
MARRCTTVPGYGTCCAAAQAGRLGAPFRIGPAGHERCAQCDVVGKRKGGQGFRFRFVKSAQCGLMSGCPALQGAGPGQGNLMSLPPAMQVPSFFGGR